MAVTRFRQKEIVLNEHVARFRLVCGCVDDDQKRGNDECEMRLLRVSSYDGSCAWICGFMGCNFFVCSMSLPLYIYLSFWFLCTEPALSLL